MLQHLSRERRATVGGVEESTESAANTVGSVIALGGLGYGVYMAVTGSIVTGLFVAMGASVAGLIAYRALSSDYDRGYSHGRAGAPMEWGHDGCWIPNPDTYNRNLETDYCRGFFDGQEDRATAGGD